MKLGSVAIVGSTGFIGSNLVNFFRENQINVEQFNSFSQHEDFLQMQSEILFIAAPNAEKWKANAHPASDLYSINKLISNLRSCNQPKEIILFSTVDVYKNKTNCNESSYGFETIEPYGRNRRYFEESCLEIFPNIQIMRLPALIGTGLKKNVLFDLTHGNQLEAVNVNSIFQWFDLSNLSRSIDILRASGIPSVNLVSQPVSVDEVIREVFPELIISDGAFNRQTSSAAHYDCKSKHASLWSDKDNGYMYEKSEIIASMKEYKKRSRADG
jgi:nucleoside-diphosphate-sugar epimerase